MQPLIGIMDNQWAHLLQQQGANDAVNDPARLLLAPHVRAECQYLVDQMAFKWRRQYIYTDYLIEDSRWLTAGGNMSNASKEPGAYTAINVANLLKDWMSVPHLEKGDFLVMKQPKHDEEPHRYWQE